MVLHSRRLVGEGNNERGAAVKVYDVAGKVAGSGEYILGAEATGSHACYLIYGLLRPGETGRQLRPGAGHEEMVLCIAGGIRLSGCTSGDLRAGQAVHLRGEEMCNVTNSCDVDAIYVIAGGHSCGEHDH